MSFLGAAILELDLPATACFILGDWSASWSCGISPSPKDDLPGHTILDTSMSQPQCSGCPRSQPKVEFLHENHQRVGYRADQRR